MSEFDNRHIAKERHAVWFSYLDFTLLETQNAKSFAASLLPILNNCVHYKINTIILQVRPFADALYPSQIFPWSHLIAGVQGAEPGYDPLQLFLEEAHRQNIRVEAWINPYRIRLNDQRPAGDLAANHPAKLHPEWTKEANGGLYFDPALPQVQELVIEGVLEIVNNYQIDGIQFDDYFYPTDDPEFDRESYNNYGCGMNLADWRRENVNKLIRGVYRAIKTANPCVEFGISPQANNRINVSQQYSDIPMWITRHDYVDYIMPQTYWGFHYHQENTGDQFAFQNITREWSALPRDPAVALYFGLGAYRIGDGDGAVSTQDEWNSGHNLADMVQWLRSLDIHGWAYFRYESLFGRDAYIELRKQELDALLLKD